MTTRIAYYAAAAAHYGEATRAQMERGGADACDWARIAGHYGLLALGDYRLWQSEGRHARMVG